LDREGHGPGEGQRRAGLADRLTDDRHGTIDCEMKSPRAPAVSVCIPVVSVSVQLTSPSDMFTFASASGQMPGSFATHPGAAATRTGRSKHGKRISAVYARDGVQSEALVRRSRRFRARDARLRGASCALAYPALHY
jgi:hypothetical protein